MAVGFVPRLGHCLVLGHRPLLREAAIHGWAFEIFAVNVGLAHLISHPTKSVLCLRLCQLGA